MSEESWVPPSAKKREGWGTRRLCSAAQIRMVRFLLGILGSSWICSIGVSGQRSISSKPVSSRLLINLAAGAHGIIRHDLLG